MMMVIVVSHFIFFKHNELSTFYSKHIRNPDLAVDFFFMLSGFGMMLSKKHKPEKVTISSSMKYAIKHVKKIYPIFLATILFGLLWNMCEAIIQSKITIAYCLSELLKLFLNITLLSQITANSSIVHAFNGVTWFLSSLFVIYIFAPTIMKALSKYADSTIKNILCILFCIAATIFLVFVFQKIEDKYPFFDCLRGTPCIRVFTVIIGMNISMLFSRLESKIRSSFINFNIAELFVTFFNIAWFFTRNSLELNRRYKILIDMVLCCSLVFIFAFDSGKISSFLKSEPLKKLGNISMYIFLIHYPLIVYFNDRTALSAINTAQICIVKSMIVIVASVAIAFLIDKCYGIRLSSSGQR